MAVLITPPFLYFTDDNGNPLSGGKVYTYEAGTTTPKATFTDDTGGTPNANPVVLDAAGRCVMWGTGSYRIDVKTSADVLVRSVDDITVFNNSATTITLSSIDAIAANTYVANATSSSASPTAVAVAANRLVGRGASGDLGVISLGSGLSFSGTTLSVSAPGRLLGITKFTANGTWTKATLNPSFIVSFIRGGGGAGGGTTAAGYQGAGGGGQGGYSVKLIAAGSLGATESVTIGAGGTAASGTTGGAGGTTSFGSHHSASGGSGGGVGINGGIGNIGSGGTATSGDLNIRGESGTYGVAYSTFAAGGGGGGEGGGAGSVLGYSGPQAGGTNSGGGGGGRASNASAGAGSDGGSGYCEVWEFS